MARRGNQFGSMAAEAMDLDEAFAFRLAFRLGGQRGLAAGQLGGTLAGGLLGALGRATTLGLDLLAHLGAFGRVEPGATRQVVVTAKLGLTRNAPKPEQQRGDGD
mgnify:CR=1 FL=1